MNLWNVCFHLWKIWFIGIGNVAEAIKSNVIDHIDYYNHNGVMVAVFECNHFSLFAHLFQCTLVPGGRIHTHRTHEKRICSNVRNEKQSYCYILNLNEFNLHASKSRIFLQWFLNGIFSCCCCFKSFTSFAKRRKKKYSLSIRLPLLFHQM